MKPARLERKTALGMEELVQQYIKTMKISSGLNTHRIFAAWNQASGAEACTIKRYYRGGKLYITLNSSVVRSQLSFQKEALIEKINDLLRQDTLLTRADPNVSWVTELILK